MKGVFHWINSSLKRINWERGLTRLEPLPICDKFLLMQLRPCLDKALLTSWKSASYQLDWFQAEHRSIVLIIGVKVRQVMRAAHFHIHPNNDAKETAQLRHRRSISCCGLSWLLCRRHDAVKPLTATRRSFPVVWAIP